MTYNNHIYIVTKEVSGASTHPHLSILTVRSYEKLAWLDIQEDAKAILDNANFIAHFTKPPFENATYNGLELVGYGHNSRRGYRYIRYRIFVKIFNEFM